MKKFTPIRLHTYLVTFETGKIEVKSFCKRMAGHRARAKRDGNYPYPIKGNVVSIQKLD